jgi:DNA-directed RNA polymerase I, II, and III subunit RPABC2
MTLRLTKYEKTKIIGLRAEQIAYGAKPKVDCEDTNPLKIAEKELEEKKIPLVLIREWPDKSKRKFVLNEKKRKLSDEIKEDSSEKKDLDNSEQEKKRKKTI